MCQKKVQYDDNYACWVFEFQSFRSIHSKCIGNVYREQKGSQMKQLKTIKWKINC